jgi:hypothetical protein
MIDLLVGDKVGQRLGANETRRGPQTLGEYLNAPVRLSA